MSNQTSVERTSDRNVVASRMFNAAPRVVFEAWTKPDVFRRWWTPKSMAMKIVSCRRYHEKTPAVYIMARRYRGTSVNRLSKWQDSDLTLLQLGDEKNA